MKKNFLFVMVFYYVFIIFSFSFQPAVESAVESEGVVEFVYKILFEKLKILPSVSKPEFVNFVVPIARKLAHFGNFFILSVLTSLYVDCYDKKTLKSACYVLLICLTVAAVDETLQLFSAGRACRGLDVVIDFSGAALGNLLYNLPSVFSYDKQFTLSGGF